MSTSEHEAMPLHLTVHVTGARGLTAMDVGGTSDPFCLVHCSGDEVGRTDTVSKTLEPAWEKNTFAFDVPPAASEIVFHVYDYDTLSSDDHIGSARLPLRALPAAGGAEVWLPLRQGQMGVADCGQVCVKVDVDLELLRSSVSGQHAFPPPLSSLVAGGSDAVLHELFDATAVWAGVPQLAAEHALAVLPTVLGDTHVGMNRPPRVGRLVLTQRFLVFQEFTVQEAAASATAVVARERDARAAGAATETETDRAAERGPLFVLPLRSVMAVRENEESTAFGQAAASLTVVSATTARSDYIVKPSGDLTADRAAVEALVSEATWLIAEDSFHIAHAKDGDDSKVTEDEANFGAKMISDEFVRQAAVPVGPSARADFRVSTVNKDYSVCPSYPHTVVVPAGVDDDAMKGAARFRTKHRFPALSWRHPSNGASLCRSSQPKVGLLGRHSETDVGLLAALRKIALRRRKRTAASSDEPVLQVCDCRPFQNAHGNAFKGGGASKANHYTGNEAELSDSGDEGDGSVAMRGLRRVESARKAAITVGKNMMRWSATSSADDAYHLDVADVEEVFVDGEPGMSDVEEESDVVEGEGNTEALESGEAVSEDADRPSGEVVSSATAAGGSGSPPDSTAVEPAAASSGARVRPRPKYETQSSFWGNGAGDTPWVNVRFLGIDNIHVMRRSLRQARKARDGDTASFHITIGQSRWLWHVSRVISGGQEVAGLLCDGHPVLVHCSDGWDRTAQVTSLSQLLLDPYLRTVEGFLVLLEKDWLGFGHMFDARVSPSTCARQQLGPGKSTGDGFDATHYHQHSPVFLQWLDCVWQLMRQQPEEFGFNELFLLVIGHSMCSGVFGTFIGSNNRERDLRNVHIRAHSLWRNLLDRKSWFVNPETELVAPTSGRWHEVRLIQHFDVKRIAVWESMYLQWAPLAIPTAVETAAIVAVGTAGIGADADADAEDEDDADRAARLEAQLDDATRRLHRANEEAQDLRRRLALAEAGVANSITDDASAATPLLSHHSRVEQQQAAQCCCSIM